MSPRPPHSKFLFFIAQSASKQLLCDELAREHPELRFAYSQPGLYTFKIQGGSGPSQPKAVFARHHGYSLGTVRNVEGVRTLLDGIEGPAAAEQAFRLHVYGRDAGEKHPTASAARVAEVRARLLEQEPRRLHAEPTPKLRERVLDVILPPDQESEQPWFVGYHLQETGRSVHPGAVQRKLPPRNAPSRAWSKLEEVIEWSSLPMRSGDTALEFGCAPGGAVLAMIDRGLRVTGVDPAAIDPSVLAHAEETGANFVHEACSIGALERERLPKRVDWLLCDANLAPQIAIRYLAHWAKLLRPHLRGIVFTLKLNDDRAVAAMPALVARVSQFGLGSVRAVQLPSHRREIAVVAYKRR